MFIYHSFLFIFRYVKNSRSKNVDLLTKDWPAVCLVKNDHNHDIESATSLKHRDMSEETKTKLLSLFIKGHNPSSALHSLKADLMLEYGDDFYKVADDGFYLPSLSRVEKLFKKEISMSSESDKPSNTIHNGISHCIYNNIIISHCSYL